MQVYLLAGLGLDRDHHLVGAKPEQTTTVLVFETTIGGPNFNFIAYLKAKRVALVNCKFGFGKGGLTDPLQCVYAFQRCWLWCSSPCFLVCIIESRNPSIHLRKFLLVEKFLGQCSFQSRRCVSLAVRRRCRSTVVYRADRCATRDGTLLHFTSSLCAWSISTQQCQRCSSGPCCRSVARCAAYLGCHDPATQMQTSGHAEGAFTHFFRHLAVLLCFAMNLLSRGNGVRITMAGCRQRVTAAGADGHCGSPGHTAR